MNPALTSASDSYLWGRDLLVHPVLNAGQKNQIFTFQSAVTGLIFIQGRLMPQATARASISFVNIFRFLFVAVRSFHD
jgi:hypothetical protein